VPKLETLPADTAPETILAVLRRDGALILGDALPDAATDALLGELRPWIDATPNGQDSFTGHQTTRTGALVARSPKTRALVSDPRILALADGFLLPFCERYQLHLTQVIRLKPGQGAQVIHRDRWAWGPHLPAVEPQLNTIWALTDFTAENGATRVVPGSLDWPDNREAEAADITQAEMRKGSLLLYSGGVFHGGGENRSGSERIGLNITYSLGWLRQEENQYLSCPPEIARTLDPALQKLLGYAMGSYALGYFTPPLPPGAGPEIVPPDYALDPARTASGFGDAELLASITGRTIGTS
jgi:ectoine hydroxylase-related dioxygenase (phytanoyl-CoA dioxygenase family)